mmetsp:Transcript_33786/g.80799  ORF Transcript_33786/g.80799 Transcript_33786/m.80799 type:complete len:177 (+) Transcript_33786:1-531(+)
MFVTQWLLTVYTSTFPFDLVARVWDSFLVEGWKVVYRVMLALLESAQADILSLSFENILGYLKDFPSTVDGAPDQPQEEAHPEARERVATALGRRRRGGGARVLKEGQHRRRLVRLVRDAQLRLDPESHAQVLRAQVRRREPEEDSAEGDHHRGPFARPDSHRGKQEVRRPAPQRP